MEGEADEASVAENLALTRREGKSYEKIISWKVTLSNMHFRKLSDCNTRMGGRRPDSRQGERRLSHKSNPEMRRVINGEKKDPWEIKLTGSATLSRPGKTREAHPRRFSPRELKKQPF